MFERFTDRARHVIVLTQDKAKLLNHNYIGTGHLLLGLIHEGEGVAARALGQMEIPLQAACEQMVEIMGQGQQVPSRHIPSSPYAKRVLELSLHEALQINHSYIGTEHILLGLTREDEGVAVQALLKLGADLGRVRSTVIRLLAGYRSKEASMTDAPEAGPEKFSSQVLDQFGHNLTQVARENRLDPVIGRVSEIERVMTVLNHRTRNNPVLISEPSVGKTAVVEGLSQAIVRGDAPETLRDKWIYTLDPGALVAGPHRRGDFEERLKKVPKEIKTRGDIMLFIDEIHTLVGTGAAEGTIGAASILKPMLTRGGLQTVGTTTLDEYHKYIEEDVTLERRFQPIQVAGLSVALTIDILKSLRDRYEAHHRITITDETLTAVATMADHYTQDRFLPGKAVDLIDEAGAWLRIQRMTAPPGLREFDEQITKLKMKKDAAIDAQNFETVARLHSDVTRIQVQRAEKERAWKRDDSGIPAVVGEEEVAVVLSSSTGVPVFKPTEEESAHLLRMEQELEKRYIGQEDAIEALTRSIRHTHAGLKDLKCLSDSFIFAGPSGIGGTELTKALTEFLLGDEDALITLDMSEYSGRHTASRIFGSPPGYVGYGEGGQLTEKVRRRPFSVMLFDEIEKTHPGIFNSLLQILDEGRLTNTQGRVVGLKNAIIMITTNLGSRDISKGVNLGFSRAGDETSSYEKMRAKVPDELKQHFHPEFLNRVDKIIMFHQLTQFDVERIVNPMVAQIESRLADRGMSIELTPATETLVAKRGFDPVFGARPLRHALQRGIEDVLAKKILFGELVTGQIVQVGIAKEGAELPFRFAGISKTPPALPTETDPVE